MVVLEDPKDSFFCLQILSLLSVQFCSLGGSVHYAYTQFTASLGLNIKFCGMAMALKKQFEHVVSLEYLVYLV